MDVKLIDKFSMKLNPYAWEGYSMCGCVRYFSTENKCQDSHHPGVLIVLNSVKYIMSV